MSHSANNSRNLYYNNYDFIVDPEIEGITPMVNESVILAWEHTNSDRSIPIIHFTVEVRPLEGTSIIHETVPGDQFRLNLDINRFEPRTSYVATITANSLFGPSSPRDVSFMTGGMSLLFLVI